MFFPLTTKSGVVIKWIHDHARPHPSRCSLCPLIEGNPSCTQTVINTQVDMSTLHGFPEAGELIGQTYCQSKLSIQQNLHIHTDPNTSLIVPATNHQKGPIWWQTKQQASLMTNKTRQTKQQASLMTNKTTSHKQNNNNNRGANKMNWNVQTGTQQKLSQQLRLVCKGLWHTWDRCPVAMTLIAKLHN